MPKTDSSPSPTVSAGTGRRHAARQRLARLLIAAALGVALVCLLGSLAALAQAGGPGSAAGAAGPDRGHVIVQFGDHDVAVRPITFTAPISGMQALELSGLHVVTASTPYGTAICSIEGVGCPIANCLTCNAKGYYWGYNFSDGQAWQGYPVGPDGTTLANGAVEGWRWGAYGDPMLPARPITAALAALDWLRPRQSAVDGGYGGDSGTSEALLAIGANHYAAADWQRGATAPSIEGYQVGHGARYTGYGAAEAGKYTVAQAGGNACWPTQAIRPSAYYSLTTGAYFAGAGPHAWAMLGTASLSQTVPAQATQYLKSLAQGNGGWEWAPGWGTDTNSTGLVVQVLVMMGEPVNSGVITRALAFLKTAQNPDGGFMYAPGSPVSSASDANSTAYVVQAIRSAGQDPITGTWRIGAANPVSYLLNLQNPDGSFAWQAGGAANQLATEQVAVALLGRTWPLRVGQLPLCPWSAQPAVRR